MTIIGPFIPAFDLLRDSLHNAGFTGSGWRGEEIRTGGWTWAAKSYLTRASTSSHDSSKPGHAATFYAGSAAASPSPASWPEVWSCSRPAGEAAVLRPALRTPSV